MILSRQDRETEKLRFRTSAADGNKFQYITKSADLWKREVRLFNRIRVSKKTGKILGFFVGGIKNPV